MKDIYVWLRSDRIPAARTKTIDNRINIDYDEDNKIIGVEILNAFRFE